LRNRGGRKHHAQQNNGDGMAHLFLLPEECSRPAETILRTRCDA
jgi:hypothetical protein